MLGDTTRGGSYETTSGANIAAYTGGQVTIADGKDLRKSNISLGKSDGAFETTAQRSFKSLTADEVKNAQVNVASATKMRTEINTHKVDMVSSSHAAASDVQALYDVKFKKHEGANMRRTNFSLGTEQQKFASEAGATFQEPGSAVYTAPVKKQKVSWDTTSNMMFCYSMPWVFLRMHVNGFGISVCCGCNVGN